MPKPVVTFGEIMLRLNPPGFERFLQTPQFVATFGGGEANVAVAVATYGVPARYVTVIPPNNAISDAFVAELRRFGVDPSHIVRGKGRFGIYFVENGANQRPSKVRLRPGRQRDRAWQSPATSISEVASREPAGSTSPASRRRSAKAPPNSLSKVFASRKSRA